MVLNYSKVSMPLADVYYLGGPNVFSYLSQGSDDEKKAVIIPKNLMKKLSKPPQSFEKIGFGGVDAMAKIKELEFRVESPYTIYKYNEKLDILFYYRDEYNSEDIQRATVDITDNFRVITRDSYEHADAKHLGIRCEDPKFLLANKDIVEKGILEGSHELLAKLYESNSTLPLEVAADILGENSDNFYNNQFFRFRTRKGSKFARVTGDLVRNTIGTRITDIENPRVELLDEKEYSKKLQVGNHIRSNILGIRPYDMEQYLISQYGIFNSDANVVFIAGGAGSGKTVLSYIFGVDQILHYDKELSIKRGLHYTQGGKQGFFEQMVLIKPNNPMGGKDRDFGFLPGELLDKIELDLMPFRDAHQKSCLDDALEFRHMFLDSRRDTKYGPKRESPKINGEAHLPPKVPIELIPSSKARGITMSNTLLIIDEAQNFTPYEMKTLISRLGDGSKMLVLGDPVQFDNSLCSPDLNGFTSSIQFILPKPYSTLIKLPRSYRSQVAEDILEMPAYSS